MKRNLLAKSILQDRPIAYHPDVARICGGVKAGVFFSQLMYWSDKGKRGDGFIWKTQEEFEQETALTRREQATARRLLKERGFLEEKLAGVPATVHYKIIWDAFLSELDEHYEQSSLHESAKLDYTEAPNKVAQSSQSIPESTQIVPQENTTNNNRDDFRAAVIAYENEIHPSLTPLIADNIGEAVDEWGGDTVVEAIGIAAASGVRNWRYIEGVLNNWRVNGRNQKGKKGNERKAASVPDRVEVPDGNGGKLIYINGKLDKDATHGYNKQPTN